MSEIVQVHSEDASDRDREILGFALSNTYDPYDESDKQSGWEFRIGDPEIFMHQDRLVVPGGKVLDLGMGGARTSLFFAMHGMEVTGYDLDPWNTAFINRLADE